jgi:hypothetical protein
MTGSCGSDTRRERKTWPQQSYDPKGRKAKSAAKKMEKNSEMTTIASIQPKIVAAEGG